jgi:hypothetical protein
MRVEQGVLYKYMGSAKWCSAGPSDLKNSLSKVVGNV